MTECFGIANIERARRTGAEKTGDRETGHNEGNESKGMFHITEADGATRAQSRSITRI
jgi:hypothetical protein